MFSCFLRKDPFATSKKSPPPCTSKMQPNPNRNSQPSTGNSTPTSKLQSSKNLLQYYSHYDRHSLQTNTSMNKAMTERNSCNQSPSVSSICSTPSEMSPMRRLLSQETFSQGQFEKKGPFHLYRGGGNIFDELILDDLSELDFEDRINTSILSSKRSDSEEEESLHSFSRYSIANDEAIVMFDSSNTNKQFNSQQFSGLTPEECITTLEELVKEVNLMIANEVKVSSSEDLIILDAIKKTITGDVYRAYNPEIESYHAFKQIEIKNAKTLKFILSEVSIIKKLILSNHQSLARVNYIALNSNNDCEGNKVYNFVLITELGQGTLQDLIEMAQNNYTEAESLLDLGEDQLMSILSSLIRQYIILKRFNLWYRDISPKSICIAEDGKSFKFFDFSLMTEINPDKPEFFRDFVGAPLFAAPEVYEQIKDKRAAFYEPFYPDLYSLGLVTTYMAANKEGEYCFNRSELLNADNLKIIKKKYPQLWSCYLKDFLRPAEKASKREKPLQDPFNIIRTCDKPAFKVKKFKSKILRKALRANQSPHNLNKFLSLIAKLNSIELIQEIQLQIFANSFDETQTQLFSLHNLKQFILKLVSVLKQNSEWDKAIESLQKVVELIKVKQDENHPDLCEIYRELSKIYAFRGNKDDSLKYLEKAQYVSLLSNSNQKKIELQSNMELGEYYEKEGFLQIAWEKYSNARSLVEDIDGVENNLNKQALFHEKLALLMIHENKLSETVSELEEAIVKYRRCFGEYDQNVARCYYQLGNYLKSAKQSKEALTYFKKYLVVTNENIEEKNKVELLQMMRDLYFEINEIDNALNSMNLSIDVLRRIDNSNLESIISELKKLSEMQQQHSRNSQAIETLINITKLIIENYGVSNIQLPSIYNQISELKSGLNKKNEALSYQLNSLRVLYANKIDGEELEKIFEKIHSLIPSAYSELKSQKVQQQQEQVQAKKALRPVRPKISYNKPLVIRIDGIEGKIRGIILNIDTKTATLGDLRRIIEQDTYPLENEEFSFLDENSKNEICTNEKNIKISGIVCTDQNNVSYVNIKEHDYDTSIQLL